MTFAELSTGRYRRLTAKQAARHKNMAAGDYALVQRILDEGETFRDSARSMIGFIEIDGQLWRAAIKATGDGSRLYLQTLHRAQPRDLAAARRRLKRIGGDG